MGKEKKNNIRDMTVCVRVFLGCAGVLRKKTFLLGEVREGMVGVRN